MAWGWIETVVRSKRPHGSGGASLIGLAKEMGEWSAWIMIVIGIAALLRFIPYGWFRKLHKAFPVAFLIGAFHSVVLLPDSMIRTPFAVLVLAIALGGSIIAVQSLVGLIGRSRRYAGKVSSVTLTPAGILDLQIKPGSDWPGHQSGQFALLTLAGCPKTQRCLRLLIADDEKTAVEQEAIKNQISFYEKEIINYQAFIELMLS